MNKLSKTFQQGFYGRLIAWVPTTSNSNQEGISGFHGLSGTAAW